MEFTDGYLRLFNGYWNVITPEIPAAISISTANPAIVTLDMAVPWQTGDEIGFLVSTQAPGTVAQLIRNHAFVITMQSIGSPPAFNIATQYGFGDLVSKAGLNYSSLTFGNVGNAPDTSPTDWLLIPPGGSNSFSLADSLTGLPFDGSTITALAGAHVLVVRFLKVATPYTAGSWSTVRIAQSQDQGIMMNGEDPPQMLDIFPNAGGAGSATASVVKVQFQDGPYLDPVPNSVATITGGLSGTVTLTAAFAAWDSTVTYAPGNYAVSGGLAYQAILASLNQVPPNSTYWLKVDPGTAVTGDPNAAIIGFQSTDVGRQIRLFSEPQLYVATTAYVAGNVVAYNGNYYISNATQTGVSPDTIPVGATSLSWILAPTAALWTWGTIQTVTSKFSVTMNIQGLPLQYAVPVRTWRLGVYSDTTGYPSCGVYYEGRFWFGGAVPNRFDTSQTSGVNKDGSVFMSPTAIDGTVGDANAISYTLLSDQACDISWFAPDHNGLMCGTLGGEWLLAASNQSDPITPTSIQAKRVTKYGCANIEPRRTGLALIFVQKFGRKIMEFLADVFTGRYIAPHLSETAKHLTAPGVEEIHYQEELAPILWARTALNTLIGATYRRISAFTTEVPTFIGWHRHDLGSHYDIESIGVNGNWNGTLDQLTVVTNYTGWNQYRFINAFTQMFDQNDNLYNAWFLDNAEVPDNMYDDTVGGVAGERFTGLYYFIGQKVTVFAGGLDVGDFTVDSNGTVFVPFGSGTQPAVIEYTKAGAGAWQFTSSYIASVRAANSANTLRNGCVVSNTDTFTVGLAKTLRSTTTIQAFVPTLNTLTGVIKNGMVMDWPAQLAFVESLSGTLGMRKFNMATAGELADPTWATIDGVAGPLNWIAASNQLGSSTVDGFLYTGSGNSNYCPLVQIDEVSMTGNYVQGTSSTFGPSISGSGGLTNPGQVNPVSIACCTANSDWIVALGPGSTTRNVTLCQGRSGGFVGGNSVAQPYQGYAAAPWIMSPGGALGAFVADGVGLQANLVTNQDGSVTAQGANMATAYIVAGDTAHVSIYVLEITDGVQQASNVNGFDNGFFSLSFWAVETAGLTATTSQPSVSNPRRFFGLVGQVTPQMVDPTWNAFTGIAGCIVDKIDNGVMTIVQNTGAAGNQQYLIKVCTYPYNVQGIGQSVNSSGNAGSPPFGVVWAIPIGAGTTIDLADMMARGSCKFGLFCFLAEQTSSNNHISKLYRIDTITGLYCIFAVPGAYHDISGHPFMQAFDDSSVSIVFYSALDTTVTGAVARVNGSGSYTGAYGQLFIGSDLVRIGGNATTCASGYNITRNVSQGGFPCVIGKCFTSQGQLLRPVLPPDTGVHMGTGFAKTRRINRFGIQLSNTVALSVGTDFGATLNPVYFKDAGQSQLLPTVTYNGVWRDSLADGYDFDSMLSWQIVRPYPASVVAYGGFIETVDI